MHLLGRASWAQTNGVFVYITHTLHMYIYAFLCSVYAEEIKTQNIWEIAFSREIMKKED